MTGVAFAAALAGLPGMGPHRLRRVLARWPDPEEAWARLAAGGLQRDRLAGVLRAGDPASLLERWRRAAQAVDPAAVLRGCEALGVRVAVLGDPAYPALLAGDEEAPAVVFWRGDLDVLRARRVAIVGTRRCTHTGRAVALGLGRDLAAAGVAVVSGLALGIDGAAHEGALAAGGTPPVGVVACGLDVVYPRRHRALWDSVAQRGLLLAECPPGTPPERWRFPARNRILAALAEVVVVVESHRRGGSRHTVDAAMERGVDVMAVPGSVRSPASAGTNELLAQGVPPVLRADDVLVALGLAGAGPAPDAAPEPPDPAAAAVLRALAGEPATLDDLVARCGLGPGAVAVALEALRAGGHVTADGVWWMAV